MSLVGAAAHMAGRLVGTLRHKWQTGISASTTPSGAGYAGGRSDRRNDNWSPSNGGPNAAADLTLDQLRARSRDLARNHPQVAGAIQATVSAVVGDSGIRVRPRTEWEDLNEQIRELQRDDLNAVDPGRTVTERRFQAELVTELFVAGELLVRFGFAEAWRDQPAGPCMEGIVAERIDLGLNSTHGANVVRQGVEVDSLGRVVAYHVYKTHPNDGMAFVAFPMVGSDAIIRVSALDCTHAMLTRQAGQLRGVPLTASVIQELALGKKLLDAGLLSALAQSCIGIGIEGASPNDKPKVGVSSTLVDTDGNPVRRMNPGQIVHFASGTKFHFFSPNLPGPSLERTMAVINQMNASALGQDIAGFSKDFGKATFSSIRADQLMVHRFYRFLQQLVYEVEARPWYHHKLAWWIASGLIELTSEQAAAWQDPRQRARILRCASQFPGFGWVDPRQEATAADLTIKAGIRSRPDVIAEYGDDPEETLREQLEFEALELRWRAELGLPGKSATPAEPESDPDDENDDETRETVTDDDEDEDDEGHATNRHATVGGAPHLNGVNGHA